MNFSIYDKEFIAPGPGDMRQGEFQSFDIEEGFKFGRTIVGRRGLTIPKDAGMKQDRFFSLGYFPDQLQDFETSWEKFVADDFESMSAATTSQINLFQGVRLERIDPEKRKEIRPSFTPEKEIIKPLLRRGPSRNPEE